MSIKKYKKIIAGRRNSSHEEKETRDKNQQQKQKKEEKQSKDQTLKKESTPGTTNEQQGQGQKKVTTCHKGKKTLRIAEPALQAHLKHGDTLGACAEDSQQSVTGDQIGVPSNSSQQSDTGQSQTTSQKSESNQNKQGKGKGKEKKRNQSNVKADLNFREFVPNTACTVRPCGVIEPHSVPLTIATSTTFTRASRFRHRYPNIRS